MRTTLDIDDPILKEVEAIHEREGRSIGAVDAELLAEALALRPSRARPPFRWVSRPMKCLVDLRDKEAVYTALDTDRSSDRHVRPRQFVESCAEGPEMLCPTWPTRCPICGAEKMRGCVAVLNQDGCDMNDRSKVSANGHQTRHVLVRFHKTVRLGQGTRVR